MARSVVQRIACLVLSAVAVSTATVWVRPTSQSPGSTAPAQISGVVFSAAALQRFDSRVAELVRSFDGDTGVWIGLPGATDPLYGNDADVTFVAASLYKLAVMLEVERLVDLGRMRYGETVTIESEDVTIDGSYVLPGTTLDIDSALERMITLSDNGTALALLRTVDARNVNATLAAEGIRGVLVAESPDEDHLVTARGLATFFGRLATGELVSPAASARMLGRLERQTIKDRLPADLPPSVRVAHKTGDLVDHRHDAGILRAPDAPAVVVVVLTKDGDSQAAGALIGRIAALALEFVSERATP